MGQVNIRRLHTCYHLSVEDESLRARLDLIRAGMLGEGLEAALDRLGVDPEEEVCIRRVHATVTLRMNDSDSALELDWSLALARSIGRAVQGGAPIEMVRYCNRQRALIDFASGIVRRDYRNIWAWRQVGIWRGTIPMGGPGDEDAVAQLIDILSCEGSSIVPILCILAGENSLTELDARLSFEDWISLAASAIVAAGGDARLMEPSSHHHPVESPFTVRGMRAAQNSILRPLAQGKARIDTHRRWAVGTLILLAHEPAALQCPAPDQLIAATVQSLWTGPSGDRRFLSRPENTVRQENPGGCLSPDYPSRSEDAVVSGISGDAPVPVRPASAADTRARGRTRWGGLLFLLWPVGECGIPQLAAERLPGRSLRFILNRLAHTLVEMDADDPASLAFAGLPPDAEPPVKADPDTTPDEDQQIEAFAEAIRESLKERLTATGGDVPIRQVCARKAEIVADPGWIEVHLSIEEVSTQLRHCGLDLNPEYIPWLGVVMRFIYE
jgi:hypothetical protein